ncbi:MAG: SGNH/GDSL hydrolase family protein [Myxococcaceae bacterium]
MTFRPLLPALFLVGVLAACGPGLAIDDPPDSGALDDGGEEADAGELPDAGEPPDSGEDLDSGVPDSGTGDSGLPDASVAPAVYPWGRTHSPITLAVASNLRRIASNGPAQNEAVFSKLGASNTVSTHFLGCFAGNYVNLAGRVALQPTLDFFRAGNAGGTTPFNRVSLCATIGWSAWSALAGTPSPLSQESAAVHPRYATVMFGTNDVQAQDVFRFGANLFDIADQLIAQGTVPIFSAIPSRDDSATADAWVPRYNAVTRGVAQARQVPFIDLHRELLPLPSHGLGPDGVHLNVYFPPVGTRGCDLTATGLRYGHNTRNLLNLTALDRARGALEGQPAPDATAPVQRGSGTLADPFVIDSLPFTDARDTSKSGANRISSYSGCASMADESGPELLYRLDLAQPVNLRAFVVSLRGSDIDLHLLGPGADAAACLARADKVVTRALPAGSYFLSLDTYVASGAVKSGEYLLVVLAEP